MKVDGNGGKQKDAKEDTKELAGTFWREITCKVRHINCSSSTDADDAAVLCCDCRLLAPTTSDDDDA